MVRRFHTSARDSFDNSPYFVAARHSHRHEDEDDATMADEPDMSVTARLDRVEGRLERVEGRLGRVEGRLERVEGRLGRVEGRLERVENGLTGLTVQVQDMRGEFRKLAELVGAGFDAMNRRFDENLKALRRRVDDHDAILGNHGRRLTALERRRK
jgi:archaellum component FlaC